MSSTTGKHCPATAAWTAARVPERKVFDGRFVRLEPLDPEIHGEQLWRALQVENTDVLAYEFSLDGPFADKDEFFRLLATKAAGNDPLFFAAIDKTNDEAQGYLSLMCIVPKFGSIEIGYIAYGACMQRTAKSTEAFFLLADEAFSLGYRRLEWKCHNGNERSKRAALRFGFTFEGVFRQHRWVKGKNRDTAWFSLLDGEWPSRRLAFLQWLRAENFDSDGRQKEALKVKAL